MVYFASFSTYNFCLRGTTSLLCGPEAQGMYNGNFVACFGWPYWTTAAINDGKSSWGKYIYQCNLPYVNTTRTTNTNLKIDSYLRYQGRPFGVNLESSMGISNCFFTDSNPANTGSASFFAGYKHVGLSSRGNFCTSDCTVAYSFTFAGWRLNGTSGTFLTSVKSHTWYFGSNYGGQNFKDIKTFAATAS
tara:strand:+ start:528 stop:1097 length:570 start_codon:yes stop_codon:yes gene_type:complete